jgi:hypothetical protein
MDFFANRIWPIAFTWQGHQYTEPAMSKPLHVPPENLSPKGPGDKKSPPTQAGETASRAVNTQQQGQQGNTKQNTTHQGLQQDR